MNGPDEWGALGPGPGTVLPECPLTQISANAQRGVFLSDQAGHGFKAFVFTADGVLPPVWQRGEGESSVAVQAVALDAPHPDVDDVLWDHTAQLPQLLGARLGGVLLIRPDGHVMARWADANHQGLAAVSTWLQRRLVADLSTSTGVTA